MRINYDCTSRRPSLHHNTNINYSIPYKSTHLYIEICCFGRNFNFDMILLEYDDRSCHISCSNGINSLRTRYANKSAINNSDDSLGRTNIAT